MTAESCTCILRLHLQVQNGERYIAWSTDKVDVETDIAATVARLFPNFAPSLTATDDLPQGQKDRGEFAASWFWPRELVGSGQD